ncbi:cytochrome b [Methylopila turkensis]|uniref:Cytochrome b n=1 Tax=Methylopila turkensis TaxID=1437816 RepID=A0A9W6JQX0_9HYPH|nr:cytochrome b [Methylopila turkensis]GLK80390.1 cytochrome b [Methylopila turkensis]
MSTTTPAAGGYTSTAKVLHWIVAAVVVAQIVGGVSLDFMADGPSKDWFYDVHKSTGVLILALMVARLGWRLAVPPPPPEPTLERWQIGLSHAVHWALYLILLAMPLLGWIGSNAFGAPVPVFGLFEMPRIVGEDKELSKAVLGWHATLGFVGAGLIALHVAAALFHRFVRKDAVLARMTTARAIREG